MPVRIVMPALSATMRDATLARWLVAEGQEVRPGMVIAEVETETATVEIEAVDEGLVERLLVPAGTARIAVNAPIAVLLLKSEAAAAVGLQSREAGHQGENARPGDTGPQGGSKRLGRIVASPLARRMARDRGLDLAAIGGTGPGGRIVKRDVERAAAMPVRLKGADAAPAARPQQALARPPEIAAVAPAFSAAAQPATTDERVLALYEPGSYRIVPHDAERRALAERLAAARRSVPLLTLDVECRIDELLLAKKRLNGVSPRSGPRSYRLTVTDFIVKAMALALQQVPEANATWLEGGAMRHLSSDIAVAVATEAGVATPVLRHAEVKTLSELSNELKHLAARAREGRLEPHERDGGTASVSNLGMHGVRRFEATLDPAHATVLAVGAGARRPVVAEDRIEIATVMSCTLSCDRRLVDGVTGAALLAGFKALIEDPVRMLV